MRHEILKQFADEFINFVPPTWVLFYFSWSKQEIKVPLSHHLLQKTGPISDTIIPPRQNETMSVTFYSMKSDITDHRFEETIKKSARHHKSILAALHLVIVSQYNWLGW
jgi:hypothetical protein